MEQLILGIAILILSIGLTFFAILQKPFNSYGVDYIFAIVGILLVWYSSSNIRNACKTKEQFANSIEGILGLLSQPAAKSANEDIGPFARNLTIYYSAFSPISYPNTTKRWYNISPYFSSPQNVCPDIKIEDTNAYFSDVPSFSPENGFSLGLNKITGPKSHQLGISANDSFSIFFTLTFNEFLQDEKYIMEFIKLFANTHNNNGVCFEIESEYNKQSNTTNSTGTFSFGSHKESLTLPILNADMVYLFLIIKQGHNIIINLYPNVGDLASTYSKYTTIADFTVKEDVLLSNKEMSINNHRNIQAHIYNFGVYNKAITTQTVNILYNNIQSQIQKYSQVLQDLTSSITNLQGKISDIKKCPYNESVCTLCSSVTDWTNMTNIILNASPDCLNAIHGYCMKNPGIEICSCWNPSNILSKTDACKSYTSIFSGGKCITPDNLDSNTLDIVKTKYNLCDCSTITNTPLPVQIKPVIVPVPKVIDKMFNANMTDIDLYNSLPVKGNMLKDWNNKS